MGDEGTDTYTNGLVLVVLSAFVLVGLFVAILVLASYRYVYRSLDVLLLGLLAALVLDVAGLVLVQATLYIRREGWGRRSCQVYTWAWLWLRLTELLLLVALSLERVLLLHARRYKHRGSTSVKLLVVFCWLGAAIIAAIPIIGWEGLDLTENVPAMCNYMIYEIDRHYAIFILVFELTAGLLALGCLADTFLHLRKYTKDVKRSPNGITMANGGIPQADKTSDPWNFSYNYIAAYDSCKLVCILLAVVFVVNHIPHALISLYVIITFNPLEDLKPHEDFRLAAQWFLLVQAAILPTCLFVFNTRYYKGLSHLGKALMCSGPYYYPGPSPQESIYHTGLRASVGESGQFHEEVTVAMPVQQVISRTRLSDINAKSNPGFESDEEDGGDVTDGRNRKRTKITKVVEVKEEVLPDRISNSSERSWVLINGYLMRSKSQEDAQSNLCNADQSSGSGEVAKSSSTGEPTPGPSNRHTYSAQSTIPLSHRFPTPDSDSSCSDGEGVVTKHNTYCSYGKETSAEVIQSRSVVVSRVEESVQVHNTHENKAFTSDDNTSVTGTKSLADVTVLSASVLATTDTTVSEENNDSVRGTPSPDSASHLPYYLKSCHHHTDGKDHKLEELEDSEAGDAPYDEDDIESVLGQVVDKVESVLNDTREEETEIKAVYEKDGDCTVSDVEATDTKVSHNDTDENKTDAKKLLDRNIITSATGSSPSSSLLSRTASGADLNIVTYMDLQNDTVRVTSPEGAPQNCSSQESITTGHEMLFPVEGQCYVSDTGSSIVQSSEETEMPRYSSVITRTQIVLPMQTSSSFHTENPLAGSSVTRHISGVYEEPIIKSVRLRSVSAMSDTSLSSVGTDDTRQQNTSTVNTLYVTNTKGDDLVVRSRHSQVMKELIQSRTTSSYSLTFPRSSDNQSVGSSPQTLPRSGQEISTKTSVPTVPLIITASDAHKDLQLRHQLQKELNLKFSSDAYLEPLESTEDTAPVHSPRRSVIHTVPSFTPQYAEPEPFPELRPVPEDKQVKVAEEPFIEPIPVLKHVPEKITTEPEATAQPNHPNGLYTENGFQHMEQDLLGRGRGKVIGTFPSSVTRQEVTITTSTSVTHTSINYV